MLAQGSAGVYPPDASVAAAALDCIDRGIVVTDSGARICLANDFARDIATRLDALSFLGGRMTFMASHLEREFERFRAVVGSWTPALTHAPRWTFSALRASGEPDYRISMHALSKIAGAHHSEHRAHPSQRRVQEMCSEIASAAHAPACTWAALNP
jgi:hypothetical protein